MSAGGYRALLQAKDKAGGTLVTDTNRLDRRLHIRDGALDQLKRCTSRSAQTAGPTDLLPFLRRRVDEEGEARRVAGALGEAEELGDAVHLALEPVPRDPPREL